MKVELRTTTKKCHTGNVDREAILGKCKLLSGRVTRCFALLRGLPVRDDTDGTGA